MIQKPQARLLVLLSIFLFYSSNQFFSETFAVTTETSPDLKSETPQLAPKNQPIPKFAPPINSLQTRPNYNFSQNTNNSSSSQNGQFGEPYSEQRENYQSPRVNSNFRPYSQGNYPPQNQYRTYQNQPYEGGYGYRNQGGYQAGQFGRQTIKDNNYHIPPSRYYGTAAYQSGSPYSARPNVVYAPQGTTLPMKLQTAISTQVAKPGDLIQGQISQMVSLGGRGYIPAGSQVVGEVSRSKRGRRLSRSGLLSIEFTSLRMPSGKMIPIQAHLVGNISKYKNKGQGNQNVYRGEGWGTKVGQLLLRGVGGAGLGAALGTGLGAIAGGGHGVGRGAWGGAAIGGGLGAADMLLRKGRDVIIPSGTEVEIQLDQQAAIPSFAQNPSGSYGGAF